MSSSFSLSWDSHRKNICNGLSSLQQNGEFVDMTLAADGHMVKVHQVVIALASPFIKELISSTKCSHPVIFLNKMSYSTLSAILEYIYTGEVVVSIDNLKELVQAAKDLHIKGLEDMKIHNSVSSIQRESIPESPSRMDEEVLEDEFCYFEISNPKDAGDTSTYRQSDNEFVTTEDLDEQYDETMNEDNDNSQDEEDSINQIKTMKLKPSSKIIDSASVSLIQYTVSNQGSLQMILNRFMYYLKHTNRDGTRQWRCVDYLAGNRCPAVVVTKDETVIQRVSSHVHAFHDLRILKKVRGGAIFTAVQEAELEGDKKRGSKGQTTPVKSQGTTPNSQATVPNSQETEIDSKAGVLSESTYMHT